MADESTSSGSSDAPSGGGPTLEGVADPAGGISSDAIIGMLGKIRGDTVLAIGVLLILGIMVLPMPPWLLDFGLACSITFSVLILMTALFIKQPLEFNVFPTVLLISTLLRLSLNVASTRLILTDGHEGPDAAGKIIESFGKFMMGDSYVTGIIVFSILVIINFFVITKGSGRIAEVSARFNLDAMPGKQMAIDADLSSGMISEDEARTRRKKLEEENSFFGAMDGASKFVRGDAIAGLIITFVNIIGGIIVGVMRAMDVGEAAQTFTLLSIGDGLVSQIPALIVSTGAGILISKAGVKEATDRAVFGQLSLYPKALTMAGIVVTVMAILPGTPTLTFLLLAAILGGTAYYLPQQKKQQRAIQVAQEIAQKEKAPVAEEPIGKSLAIDDIKLELGYGLLPLVNSEEGPHLTQQIKGLRKQLAGDMGFILPSVRIQDNLNIEPNTYVIKIKEIESGRGNVRVNMLLCMDPGGNPITLAGEATREPTFNLPAMWVDPGLKEEASFRGYTVVNTQTVIITHLTEVARDNLSELLSYAATQNLLDELGPEHQKLVSDVIPNLVTVTGLQRILQNLLKERVSIRDLPTILEGASEASTLTKSVTVMTEHVRTRLARQLCDTNVNSEGVVPMIPLSPEWEQAFSESLYGDGEEKQLAMAPTALQDFIVKVRTAFEQQAQTGELPVLVTSPMIRPYVRSIIERFRPQTVILSQNEIHPKAKIKTVGQV